MNTTKFVTVVVGSDKVSVAEPITRVDRGLRLRIKGVALPATYEVDFSLSEKSGESVTVIGDAQGAEIPIDHIRTGKNIYAWIYWVGEDYGRRVKEVMIPNDAGPDRTDITPEPAEQSVIDQTISKLNEAVSHAPRIGTDGCWELWDPEQGEYVSTGENSKGETGNSGVYIGDDEPTDEDINVWIDTDGDADEGDAPSGTLKYVKDDPTDGGGVIEGHIPANSASGAYAHSEGDGTTASAPCSHAEGYQTTASNTCSHAEGRETNANAFYAHAEGYQTTVSSMCGHAEGAGNTVSGDNAHAEGSGNTVTASGLNAHAEGNNTTASGRQAHSEGGGTTASGECSHAEGAGTRATGSQAHSEGGGTLASGNQAHAEGASTTASGDNSHAEGLSTTASGALSHAEGCGTIAARKSQHVIGEYNVADTEGEDGTNKGEYVLIVGNGDYNNRSNAFAIKWDGTFVMADGTEVPVADISELATRLNVHFTNGANDKTYTQIVAAINAGKTVIGYCNGTPSASVQMVHNDYRNMDEVKFVFIEGLYETQYMRLTGLKAMAITVGPNYAETSSYNTISFDA